MGFFDGREDAPTGLSFVSKEEKKVLADNAVPLTVISVGLGAGFEGRGKAWFFVTEIEGEERAVGGFTVGSGVDSRDALFEDMQKYLADPYNAEEPPVVCLKKAGRAWLVVNAATAQA